jgi:hypothetical protein
MGELRCQTKRTGATAGPLPPCNRADVTADVTALMGFDIALLGCSAVQGGIA